MKHAHAETDRATQTRDHNWLHAWAALYGTDPNNATDHSREGRQAVSVALRQQVTAATSALAAMTEAWDHYGRDAGEDALRRALADYRDTLGLIV